MAIYRTKVVYIKFNLQLNKKYNGEINTITTSFSLQILDDMQYSAVLRLLAEVGVAHGQSQFKDQRLLEGVRKRVHWGRPAVHRE